MYHASGAPKNHRRKSLITHFYCPWGTGTVHFPTRQNRLLTNPTYGTFGSMGTGTVHFPTRQNRRLTNPTYGTFGSQESVLVTIRSAMH